MHSPFCAEIVPDSVTPGLLVMFVAEVNARQFSQLPSASALAGTNPRSRESVAFRKRGIMIDAVVLETPRCTEAPPVPRRARKVRGDQASPWGPGLTPKRRSPPASNQSRTISMQTRASLLRISERYRTSPTNGSSSTGIRAARALR